MPQVRIEGDVFEAQKNDLYSILGGPPAQFHAEYYGKPVRMTYWALLPCNELAQAQEVVDNLTSAGLAVLDWEYKAEDP